MACELIKYQTEPDMAEPIQVMPPVVCHVAAMAKVEAEFPFWNQRRINVPSLVERHFQEATQAAKRIAAEKKLKGKSNG